MIVKGDLFEVLEKLEDDIADLVVTSPPYYNARNYGGETLFERPLDWENWCISVLLSLKRVIKPSGVIWWNTGSGYKDHKKMTNIYSIVHHCNLNYLYLIDEIPWCKTSGPPKYYKNRPPHMWEHNYVLAKNPEEVTFYRDSVREPYSKSSLERYKYKESALSGDKEGEFDTKVKKIEPHPDGKVPNNYLLLPQDTTARPHPATMQPRLANWAIRAYSQEDDFILDPMAGIGTTWVEAVKLNRRFLGIELFQEYIDIANLSMSRYNRGLDPYRGLKEEWEEKSNE